MNALVKKFDELPQIVEFNDKDHSESWTLVHSLSGLAEASDEYLKMLPSILDETVNGSELIQRLIVVVNGLEHMLYHLEDPRFFRQFLEPLRQDWEQQRAHGLSHPHM